VATCTTRTYQATKPENKHSKENKPREEVVLSNQFTTNKKPKQPQISNNQNNANSKQKQHFPASELSVNAPQPINSRRKKLKKPTTRN
jgi:hypothetical protein